MTWSRALACWVAALLLVLLVRATAPRLVAEPALAPEVVAAAGGAAPEPAATPEAGYQLDPAQLTRVEVRRGEKTVVLEQTDGRWTVVAPKDRTIPLGLVQAFVAQLVDSGQGERIAQDPSDPAFGFAEPRLLIDAASADGGRLSLVVGARTPAGAASYALIEQDGRVVLVGLNLLYYGDLLLG